MGSFWEWILGLGLTVKEADKIDWRHSLRVAGEFDFDSGQWVAK
jgi:hypothetical protein